MIGLSLDIPTVAFLGGANKPSGPAAPDMLLDPSWTSSQSTVLFNFDGAFVAGDDLQVEVQVAGGDWSLATVVHHTITSGDLAGTSFSLGIGPLSNASYEGRAKFKHSVGVYGSYSTGAGPSGGLPFTVAAAASTFDVFYPLLAA